MASGRVRLLLRAAVAVVAVVFLAGCQARLDLSIALEGDGSGTLTIALGADPELREQTAQAGADPLDALARAGDDLVADGWAISDVVRPDGARRVRLRAPFADPEAFAVLAEDLQTALDAPEVTLVDDLAVIVDDDVVGLRGQASLVPTEAITEAGLQPDQAVAVLRDTEALRYTVGVTLPGEVRSASGVVDDEARTVTWEIRPGEMVALDAVAERPGLPLALQVAFGAAGAVVVLLAALLVRRLLR